MPAFRVYMVHWLVRGRTRRRENGMLTTAMMMGGRIEGVRVARVKG